MALGGTGLHEGDIASHVVGKQVQGLADELWATSRANRDLLMGVIRSEIERAMGSMGVATADDVEVLTARLVRIERRVGAGEGAAGTYAEGAERAVRGAPAKKTAAKKSAAKKTAAKKSTAKKAAAKKSPAKKVAANKAPSARAPEAPEAPEAREETSSTSDSPTSAPSVEAVQPQDQT